MHASCAWPAYREAVAVVVHCLALTVQYCTVHSRIQDSRSGLAGEEQGHAQRAPQAAGVASENGGQLELDAMMYRMK